jgi:hypothetical protein
MISQIISTIMALLIVAGFIWLYSRYKEARGRKAAGDAQKAQRQAAEKAQRLQKEVEPLYQEYLRHLDALREKHDPEHKWRQYPINEPDLPQSYRDDLNALTENYSGVLVVRFGDSIVLK